VPVFDSAVALNTGVLTYKECVLRNLVNQTKQAMSLTLTDRNYKYLSGQIPNGRGEAHNPYWVVNYYNELGRVNDRAFQKAFQSGVLSSINSAFQSQVKNALQRNYLITTRAPQYSMTCPYEGNLGSVIKGQSSDVWGGLTAMLNPACSPYSAYMLSQNQMNSQVAAAQYEWESRLKWNNGIYDVRDSNDDVVVPGIFLNAVGTQSLTSGFRQLENADDIGEMVGWLFAGIGSRLVSGPSSIASVQTHIDNAMQQQQGTLAGAAVSTALTNLYQLLTWEQQYNDILDQIATILTSAVNQVRNDEKACFASVISHVCSASSTPSGGTCESTTGVTLSIATSTQFSDAAIAKENIAAYTASLVQVASTSDANLITLNALIAEVQSNDATTRNNAITKLNAIVSAQPTVYTSASTVSGAQEELADIQHKMLGEEGVSDGFVRITQQKWRGDAKKSDGTILQAALPWDGTIDPGTGWCNVSKEDTLTQWIAKWTQ